MGDRVFIIAEAGVNHDGSLDRALRMVDAAAACEADAIKFQTFSADALVTSVAPKASYQRDSGNAEESQHAMLKRLELSESDHEAIVSRCRERGIVFMSAAFDPQSFEFLLRLGLDRVKIASGELTNVPYLRRVAAVGLPVYLSTGMATLDEVEAALKVLENAGMPRTNVTVLHCTTEYPTPLGDVNLRAMCTMHEELGVEVGYSDHTRGVEVALAAVALGARVIEKHFTLDRTSAGPDHKASLEPDELAGMVAAIRRVEEALGSGKKMPSPAELANAAVARKSIVAARPIEAGATISADMLAVKRPGTGVSPLRWDDLIGRVASRSYGTDDLIDEEELQCPGR